MSIFSINKEKIIYAVIILIVIIAVLTYLKGWIRQ